MEHDKLIGELPRAIEIYFDQELKIAEFASSCVSLDFINPMMLPFGLVTKRPSGLVIIDAVSMGKRVYGIGEGVTLDEPLFTDDSGHNIVQNTQRILNVISAAGNITFSEALGLIQDFQFEDDASFPTARLAVEMALVEVVAVSNGISVKEMIGIPDSVIDVAYGKSLGTGLAEEIFTQASDAISNGSSKIKLKISPDSFINVFDALQRIKSELPDAHIMIDANGTFDPGNTEHLEMISLIDNLDLSLIEEPVSRDGDVKGISAVRLLRSKLPKLKTPICLDDCLSSFEICEDAITEGLAQVINIKPGRLGSFVKSLALVDWVNDKGGQVMVGGMFEATPGRCMTTLLAAYCAMRGSSVVGDLSLAQERLADDLVKPEQQLQMNSRGNIILPTKIGWGF